MTSLRFRVTRSAPDEDLEDLWKALVVMEQWALVLLILFDPVWDGVFLWISAAREADADCLEKLATLLLYLFSSSLFSATRWGGVGPSTRSLCRCWLLGLDGVVGVCKADTEAILNHINGYKKGGFAVKRLAIVAALASCPCESVIYELLEDDRIFERAAFF